MKKSTVLYFFQDLYTFLKLHRETTHDFLDAEEIVDWTERNYNNLLKKNPDIHFPCIVTLYVNGEFSDGVAMVGVVYPEDFN